MGEQLSVNLHRSVRSAAALRFFMRIAPSFAIFIPVIGLLTAAADTEVGGTLTASSLRLIAPASFIPGMPFLVRVDLLN